MRNPNLFIAQIQLVLLTVCAPCTAQYVCGPQWLENLPAIDGTVYAATTWDPDDGGPGPELLILAGDFSTVGVTAANSIAGFDGSNWWALGDGIDGTVRALTVHDGHLIAAGDFDTAGSVSASNIAVWDGSNWSALASGLNHTVKAVAVYNGLLYAGGDLTIGGTRSVARWTGVAWEAVGGGVSIAGCPTCGTTINALAVFGNDLVAGGYFDRAGALSAYRIASWDGTSWRNLDGGVRQGEVNCLTVYNGQLIVGGIFTAVGGTTVPANRIAATNGPNWWALGGGMSWSVNALAVHNGRLYAGGFFTQADGSSANYMAEWDGAAWTPLGSGMNSGVRALTVYGGDLIAGGHFTLAGGNESMGWARWRDTPPPQITSPPTNQTVMAGDDVHFAVAGAGVAPLEYQWRKNGAELSDGGRISGAQTAALNITGAQPGDVGWYDVIVTDVCNPTTSAAAYLTVNCPLAFSTAPAPQVVTVGDAATFTVGVTGAMGAAQYSWRRFSTSLEDDGWHIFGSESASLRISPAGVKDAGSYSVVVTDDCGSVTSPAAALTVNCNGMVTPDVDRDCDVDLADLATFVLCTGGPGGPRPQGCPRWPNEPGRPIADFDDDDDTDLADFEILQRCFSGRNLQAILDCAE